MGLLKGGKSFRVRKTVGFTLSWKRTVKGYEAGKEGWGGKEYQGGDAVCRLHL